MPSTDARRAHANISHLPCFANSTCRTFSCILHIYFPMLLSYTVKHATERLLSKGPSIMCLATELCTTLRRMHVLLLAGATCAILRRHDSQSTRTLVTLIHQLCISASVHQTQIIHSLEIPWRSDAGAEVLSSAAGASLAQNNIPYNNRNVSHEQSVSPSTREIEVSRWKAEMRNPSFED